MIKGIKFLLLSLGIVIGLSGCIKEEVVLDSPSITILSAKTTALTEFEIVIEIKKGEGQKMKKAELILDDITVLGAPDIEQELLLNDEEKQTDTLIINTYRQNHDFEIKACLQTDRYTYESTPKVLRSSKNWFIVDVFPSINYSGLFDSIADYVNVGGSFNIEVYYLNVYTPKTVEVKLNRTISLKHSLDFKNYFFSSSVQCLGEVFVPEDLAPGIYDVYVYIDGNEYKTANKIKILKGKWQTMNPNYPGDEINLFAWFVINDDLYLIEGNLHVWKYNFESEQWEQKKDFPHMIDVNQNKILSLSLQYKNKGYVVLQIFQSLEIWKYDEVSDSWSFVTKYPVAGNRCRTSFIVGNNLFFAGDENMLWSLDLETLQWVQKNNIPIVDGGGGNLSCVIDNSVYVYSFTNDLWQYYPETDQWTKKKKFPGHNRYVSSMVAKNNNLYLLGGAYSDYGVVALKDCWEYSTKTDSWDLVAFMPELFSDGISFNYQGSIYAGIGWVVSGYSGFYNKNFYRLDI